MRRSNLAAVAPVLAALLAVAGCGSSGGGKASGAATNSGTSAGGSSSSTVTSGSSGAPADKAAATAQIKTAYKRFFEGNAGTAVRYVQDGPALRKSFSALQKLEQGATVTATVKQVSFTGAGSANVTYSLALGDHVVLPTASGMAVRQNGKWVVAKATFCGLAQFGEGQGKKVAGC